jgi:hypothetical protein
MKTRQQQKDDDTETELQALLQQAAAAMPLNINNSSILKNEGGTLLPRHASKEENKDFRCCSTKQEGQSAQFHRVRRYQYLQSIH